MSLYSVLMVDDEEEVIRIIRRKINWEEMGFEVCGQARNGLEALEMVEELQPDVVMTDIKMPYMDGLELVAKLREKNMGIHTIVLSGFDEFDYVKKAIGLEVEEYLLKPIDSSEIIKVFTKVKNALDEERDMQKNIAYLENYYLQSLPILREGFFSDLMDSAIPEGKIPYYTEEYMIDLSGPNFAVAVVHTSRSKTPEGIGGRLMQMSVRQLLENSQLMKENRYAFNYRDNIVVLAQFDSEKEVSAFTDELDRFCKYAKRTSQAVVTIGIGHVVDSIKEIPSSYGSAREAVSYRALYGAGNAINIAEIDPGENRYDIQDNDLIHSILKQIKMGSEDRVKEAIEDYISSIQDAHMNIQTFGIALMELVTSLYRFMNANEIDLSEVSSDNKDVYTKLLQMDSMEAIQNWLTEISLKLREQVQGQRNIKTGSFVGKAKHYVLENFSNPDLSIDMVCSELGVSSAYFSTIFKKETGKTFLNYLTECRMKEAERLLIVEEEKTYIIAEKVGYSDPGYFSYVFKKWFGVSPMKYKKQRS